MARYHINLVTGTPGVCRVTTGRCPFGTAENHYDSYEEAQEVADLYATAFFINDEENHIENKFITDVIDEEEKRKQDLKEYFKFLDDYSDDDLRDYLLGEGDKVQDLDPEKHRDLVLGVFNGELLEEQVKEDPVLFTCAMVSEDFPEEIVRDVHARPGDWSARTILGVAFRRDCTPTQALQLMRGHEKDEDLCDEICIDEYRFSREFIEKVALDLEVNGDKNYPRSALALLYNSNIPSDYRRKVWPQTRQRAIRDAIAKKNKKKSNKF